MALCREWLDAHGALDSAALADCEAGRIVRAGGLVVMHQAPPTVKGMHFITLEDEAGLANVVVRPDVYERYRRVIRGSAILVVEGEIQRRDGVVNLAARRVARVA